MMDRIALKTKARKILDNNLGHLVFAFAITVAIPMALTGGSNRGVHINHPFGSGLTVFGLPFEKAGILVIAGAMIAIVFIVVATIVSIISIAISLYSMVGTLAFQKMCLKAYDGDSVQASNLFDIKDYWQKGLLLVLWMLLRIILWSLLFVIPGIIAAYRYALAPYILFEDPSKSIDQCIDESIARMNGREIDLFIQDISFFLWFCLIPITFGLASLYVGPYFMLARTGFYREIKDITVQATPAVADSVTVVTE
jgi:uncharacterized membrane protein